MNVLVSNYDDRNEERYKEVQTRTRLGLIGGLGAIGLALISIGIGWTASASTTAPLRDWVLGGFTVVFGALGILFIVLLPPSRYYIIHNGRLGYPRWGGIRRGRVSLSEFDAFRREGRDANSATLFLFRQGKRTLTIPEDELASPGTFARCLHSNGLEELPPRFRIRPDAS